MASTAAVEGNNSHIDNRIGTRPVADERSTCDVRGAQAAQGAVGGVGDGQGGRPEQAGASTSAQEGESRHLGAPVSSSGEIISPGTSQRRSSVPTEHQQSQPDQPATVKLREEIEGLQNTIQSLQEKEKKTKRGEEIKELTERIEELEFEERLAVGISKLKEKIKNGEPDGSPTTKKRLAKQQNQLKRIEEAEAESFQEVLLEGRKKLVEEAKAKRWPPWGKTKRSSTLSCDIENLLAPTLPESYLEIKRLLWIEGQRVQKKALEVWRYKEDLLTKRVERKKNKVAELKNEVYQLIGFFSVFQGVVLTAVTQASQLHCHTRWIPISLSILASVVTIAGVIQKLDQIKDFQKTVHSEEDSLKEVIARASTLKKCAERFRFVKFYDRRTAKQKRSQQTFYSAFVIISLLAFTVLFPISHWKILCHSG